MAKQNAELYTKSKKNKSKTYNNMEGGYKLNYEE